MCELIFDWVYTDMVGGDWALADFDLYVRPPTHGVGPSLPSRLRISTTGRQCRSHKLANASEIPAVLGHRTLATVENS